MKPALLFFVFAGLISPLAFATGSRLPVDDIDLNDVAYDDGKANDESSIDWQVYKELAASTKDLPMLSPDAYRDAIKDQKNPVRIVQRKFFAFLASSRILLPKDFRMNNGIHSSGSPQDSENVLTPTQLKYFQQFAIEYAAANVFADGNRMSHDGQEDPRICRLAAKGLYFLFHLDNRESRLFAIETADAALVFMRLMRNKENSDFNQSPCVNKIFAAFPTDQYLIRGEVGLNHELVEQVFLHEPVEIPATGWVHWELSGLGKYTMTSHYLGPACDDLPFLCPGYIYNDDGLTVFMKWDPYTGDPGLKPKYSHTTNTMEAYFSRVYGRN